eukprot:gene5266-2016_t
MGTWDLGGPLGKVPSLAFPSIYFASGDLAVMMVLLVVHTVVAVCFTAGFHTRKAAVVLYVLDASLSQRMGCSYYAGDRLRCLMLFWAMWLPVSARLSVDAYRARRAAPPLVVVAFDCARGGAPSDAHDLWAALDDARTQALAQRDYAPVALYDAALEAAAESCASGGARPSPRWCSPGVKLRQLPPDADRLAPLRRAHSALRGAPHYGGVAAVLPAVWVKEWDAARRRNHSLLLPPRRREHEAPVLALVLLAQIVMMEWGASMKKTGMGWQSGAAVFTVLQATQVSRQPFANWLALFPSLCFLLVRVMLLAQRTLVFAMLCPIQAVRSVAAVTFVGVHLGMHVTLDLHLFPLTVLGLLSCAATSQICDLCAAMWARAPRRCVFAFAVFLGAIGMACIPWWLPPLAAAGGIAAWPHVPTTFPVLCQGPAGKGGGREARCPPAVPGLDRARALWRRGRPCGRACLLAFLWLMLYCMVHNLNANAGTVFPMPQPPRTALRIQEGLGLSQRWRMFSPGPPPYVEWQGVSGRTFQGRAVDLWRDGDPSFDGRAHEDGRPYAVPQRAPRRSHRMFNMMGNSNRHNKLSYAALGRWICARYNAQHRDKLHGLRVLHFEYYLSPSTGLAVPRRGRRPAPAPTPVREGWPAPGEVRRRGIALPGMEARPELHGRVDL